MHREAWWLHISFRRYSTNCHSFGQLSCRRKFSAAFPSKAGVCVGNVNTNIGTFLDAASAHGKNAAEYLEMAGSLSNMVAGIGFMSRDPNGICQIAKWVGAVADTGCKITVMIWPFANGRLLPPFISPNL